jgi:hypothetical protein
MLRPRGKANAVRAARRGSRDAGRVEATRRERASDIVRKRPAARATQFAHCA